MIVGICLRFARWTIPAHRAGWLEAMACELAHVSQPDRRRFAIGCLIVALTERIKLMSATPPLRIVPGLFGSALLTVLCLANAVRFYPSSPVVGGFLFMACGLWLAMLFAVHAQTAPGVARIATVGACLYAAVGLLSLAGVPAFVPQGELLQMLALEGVILFAAAFGIAQIAYFWSARQKGDAIAPPL